MIQALNNQRPLHGLTVGISVSESAESGHLGFTTEEVNRTVRLISQALLGQGAHLVFGHDWRADGVMAQVYDFALNYLPTEHNDEAEPSPLITNFVPWPIKSGLSNADRERYRQTLRVVECEKWEMKDFESNDTLTRVSSLTYMRKQLVAYADARICIGGRTKGSGGRFAGVAEEAFMTMMADKPLYLSGMFDGASKQVINAIESETPVDIATFTPRQDIAEYWPVDSFEPDTVIGQGTINLIREFGISGLSVNNHLQLHENQALFQATQISDVIGWLLEALKRLDRSKGDLPINR